MTHSLSAAKRRPPLVYGEAADGRMVHIDEVPRGLACECHCAACGERLIARHGAENLHSFAHESGAECASAVETALHRFAKQVVADELQLILPEWPIEEGHRIVADVALVKGGRYLLVEVRVTHECDVAKIAKIRALDHSAMEISLRHLSYDSPPAVVREAVLSTAPRTWLANPKLQKREAEVRADWCAEDEKSQQMMESARASFVEQRRMAAYKQHGHGAASIVGAIERGPIDKRTARGAQYAMAHVYREGCSQLIDVPLQGDFCFPDDRAFWQAIVFEQMILNSVLRRPPSFSVQFAVRCAEKRGLLIEGIPGFVSNDVEALVQRRFQSFRSPHKVLQSYFEHLAKAKVLARHGDNWCPLPAPRRPSQALAPSSFAPP